jgi:hypothetical protein
MSHQLLPDAGHLTHTDIDLRLPTAAEKNLLAQIADNAPITVTGARDDPEEALANLLAALEALGLIVDNTTAS